MTGWLRGVFGVDDAQDAATEAAEVTAAGQTEALDYLKEQSALPTEMRDNALRGLGDYYQVPGERLGQQELIDQAYASPLYQALVGTKKQGEQAVLKNASATGGLRSGNSSRELFEHTQGLYDNALLNAYNEQKNDQNYERAVNLQGLTGLAGLSGNENAIAGLTASIGQTMGQGALARGQIKADGMNNIFNTLVGGAAAGAEVFSDIRLKDDIRFLSNFNGVNIYGWTWNKLAKQFGLSGECSGVMAHEIHETTPEATTVEDGYVKVFYDKIPQFSEAA